mmetsp:Transcript_32195/g.36534  ORF Transcript_32195/g.36534 Transcript_32195/m.36534 type:complete len:354 (-) Transcript_32195:360-1421(-)
MNQNPDIDTYLTLDAALKNSRSTLERVNLLRDHLVRNNISNEKVEAFAGGSLVVRFDADNKTEKSTFVYRVKNGPSAHWNNHLILLAAAVALNETILFNVDVILVFQQALDTLGTEYSDETEINKLLTSLGNSATILFIESSTSLKNTLSVRPGPVYSDVSHFKVTISGTGGHGSMPHAATDPIGVGAAVVRGISKIRARDVDARAKCDFTVTGFKSGTVHNVIPKTAEVRAVLRTHSKQLTEEVTQNFKKLVELEGQIDGCKTQVEVKNAIPLPENTAALANDILVRGKEIFGADQVGSSGLPLLETDSFASSILSSGLTAVTIYLRNPSSDRILSSEFLKTAIHFVLNYHH